MGFPSGIYGYSGNRNGYKNICDGGLTVNNIIFAHAFFIQTGENGLP